MPLWLTTERVIVGGIVLSIVALLGYVFISTAQYDAILNTELEGVEFFPVASAEHVNMPVAYAQTPPVGGNHFPVWQTCGVYTEPLIDEHAVHSLEHGAVWITYQPDLPADQLAKLQDITRQTGYRLLSPYPGIDSPIILSVWGYQLHLEDADDPRLMAFLLKYEQGPTTPEPGATCAGGVTTTKG